MFISQFWLCGDVAMRGLIFLKCKPTRCFTYGVKALEVAKRASAAIIPIDFILMGEMD